MLTSRFVSAGVVLFVLAVAIDVRAGRQFDDEADPPQSAPMTQPGYASPTPGYPFGYSHVPTSCYGTRRFSGYRPYEPTDLYSRQVEHGAYTTSGGPYGFQLGMSLAAGFADQAASPVGYGYRYPWWNSGYYNNGGGFYPGGGMPGQPYGGQPYPGYGGGYGPYSPPVFYQPGPANLVPRESASPYITGPTFW